MIQKLLIPKSNGKSRLIYAPDPELKRRLRSLVPQLNLLAEELDTFHVQHGFTEGRSPVTNARCHIGFAYTLSFDLADWFDSVTMCHVSRACWSPQIAAKCPPLKECFVEGAARQGLPTSPALANIAAAPMIKEIMSLCPKGRFAEKPFVFTTYADDLCFSSNSRATIDLLLQEIPKIVDRHYFKINTAKTKLQAAVSGNRIITGVSVSQTGVTIPRELRRRIRAGHHQDRVGLRRRNIRRLLFDRKRWKTKLPLRARFYFQLKGLVEWSKLKSPHNERIPQNKIVAAAARVVTAVAGKNISNRIFGSFSRRFG